jgi:membrane protein
LEYFNTYNKTYGSLGAVIILMLWLYLTALVILIGGAINSIIEEVRVKHQPEIEENRNETI